MDTWSVHSDRTKNEIIARFDFDNETAIRATRRIGRELKHYGLWPPCSSNGTIINIDFDNNNGFLVEASNALGEYYKAIVPFNVGNTPRTTPIEITKTQSDESSLRPKSHLNFIKWVSKSLGYPEKSQFWTLFHTLTQLIRGDQLELFHERKSGSSRMAACKWWLIQVMQNTLHMGDLIASALWPQLVFGYRKKRQNRGIFLATLWALNQILGSTARFIRNLGYILTAIIILYAVTRYGPVDLLQLIRGV